MFTLFDDKGTFTDIFAEIIWNSYIVILRFFKDFDQLHMIATLRNGCMYLWPFLKRTVLKEQNMPSNLWFNWGFFLFVCFEFFSVSLENFSLIWKRHQCRWRAANFYLCSALIAIGLWGFFSVPHLLWHGASV